VQYKQSIFTSTYSENLNKKYLSMEYSHWLVIVFNTYIAAVNHIQCVPGPGIAQRIQCTTKRTFFNFCLPVNISVLFIWSLSFIVCQKNYLVAFPTNILLIAYEELKGVPVYKPGASTKLPRSKVLMPHPFRKVTKLVNLLYFSKN